MYAEAYYLALRELQMERRVIFIEPDDVTDEIYVTRRKKLAFTEHMKWIGYNIRVANCLATEAGNAMTEYAYTLTNDEVEREHRIDSLLTKANMVCSARHGIHPSRNYYDIELGDMEEAMGWMAINYTEVI